MKFSLRKIFADLEPLSVLTRLTLRPPGFKFSGIHASNPSFIRNVRESFCGSSSGFFGSTFGVVFFFVVFFLVEVFLVLVFRLVDEAVVFFVLLEVVVFFVLLVDVDFFVLLEAVVVFFFVVAVVFAFVFFVGVAASESDIPNANKATIKDMRINKNLF